MHDTIISISFFSDVLSVQHLFSLLSDYSHCWVCGCLSNLTYGQMSRHRQTDNTQSTVYRYATSFLSKPTF